MDQLSIDALLMCPDPIAATVAARDHQRGETDQHCDSVARHQASLWRHRRSSNSFRSGRLDGCQNAAMDAAAAKATLKRYLDVARDALLWKLEGLSEYDVRRPLTPTASNLLGIVKHVASVENGYLGDVFGRPSGEPLPWFEEGAEANDDMWVTPDETREDILGLYQRTRAHSDATIEALSLDSVGEVPWWPEDRRQVTLHQILVHITTETHRHAGHADIIRELIDGAAGFRAEAPNLPPGDAEWWAAYRTKVEAAAAAFSD